MEKKEITDEQLSRACAIYYAAHPEEREELKRMVEAADLPFREPQAEPDAKAE